MLRKAFRTPGSTFTISLPSRLALIVWPCRRKSERRRIARLSRKKESSRHQPSPDWAHDVDEALEPGDEIGSLDPPEVVAREMAPERTERLARPAGEDEDRRPERMGDHPLKKAPSCMGIRKWRSQPRLCPSRAASTRREDKRIFPESPVSLTWWRALCRFSTAVNWETLNPAS